MLVLAAGSLVKPLGDAKVDWERGVLVAEGGAAADIRMPSIDAARPGSERRARAAAEAKLRAALEKLPLGRDRKLGPEAIDKALAAAKAEFDYTSNGGATVTLELSFCQLAEAGAGDCFQDAPSVSVASMAFAATTGLVIDAAPAPAWVPARYRAGAAPTSAKARPATLDKDGRLLVKDAKFKAAAVTIYVGKVPGG